MKLIKILIVLGMERESSLGMLEETTKRAMREANGVCSYWFWKIHRYHFRLGQQRQEIKC